MRGKTKFLKNVKNEKQTEKTKHKTIQKTIKQKNKQNEQSKQPQNGHKSKKPN